MEGRSRRQIILPIRFRDMVPGNLAELPLISPPPTPLPSETITIGGTPHMAASVDSPRNEFGLFRRYHSDTFPIHDPEEHVNLHSLTDTLTSTEEPQAPTTQQYGPFNNRSAFQLGEWFINDGAQKSKRSFRKLVDIVGSPSFSPADIRNTKWDRIHRLLGQNEDITTDSDQLEEGWEWMEEDAGWIRSDVSINVPFNRGMKNPGVREFIIRDFYHRSIVAVIREKLANSRDDALFHYEPYELFWQPDLAAHPGVRVQGELYTSPAFLAAHLKLQKSPPEPGCTLPRCIVGLQWASDSTHLTSYGNAKVWPCYLYFGNESKYRRCKPTANLCNHVAYFQIVSAISLRWAC